MKKFLRRAALQLHYSMVGLLLLLLPTAFLCSFVFTQPTVVKKVLHDSGIYPVLSKTISDNLVSTVTTQHPAISRDIAAKAVEKVASPSLVEQKSTLLIDDTYAWLDGSTRKFSPRFNLAQETLQFTAALTSTVVEAINQKPECTPAQVQQLIASQAGASPTLDVMLGWPCKVPGIDLSKISQTVSASQVDTSSLPSVDASNIAAILGTNQSGPQSQLLTTVGESLQQALPIMYKIALWSFLATLVVLALTVGAIWLLHAKNLIEMLRRLAKTLVINGLLLAAYSVVTLWTMSGSTKLLKSDGSLAQLASVQTMLKPFASLAAWVTIVFALLYIVVAIGLYVRRRQLLAQKLLREASAQLVTATPPSESAPVPVQATPVVQPQQPVVSPVPTPQPTIQEVIRYNRDHD